MEEVHEGCDIGNIDKAIGVDIGSTRKEARCGDTEDVSDECRHIVGIDDSIAIHVALQEWVWPVVAQDEVVDCHPIGVCVFDIKAESMITSERRTEKLGKFTFKYRMNSHQIYLYQCYLLKSI